MQNAVGMPEGALWTYSVVQRDVAQASGSSAMQTFEVEKQASAEDRMSGFKRLGHKKAADTFMGQAFNQKLCPAPGKKISFLLLPPAACASSCHAHMHFEGRYVAAGAAHQKGA